MSRPSHLPPRCPLQNKCLRTRSLDSSEQISQGDNGSLSEVFRHPSMDSLLEERPSWLDDLLTDSDSSSQGQCHRRSASDSLTIFQDHNSLDTDTVFTGLPSAVICDSQEEGSIHGSGVEANCVYGPNSPRQRNKLTNSENEMVNALLVPTRNLQYAEISGGIRAYDQDQEGNPSPELEHEKSSRRRSGQRSRVRKLQYISDLQKTVEALETIGAELAAQVASLFQQRVALSLENKSVRKQIALLLHEKIIKEGEHQYLKNEAERLKMISSRHRRSRSNSSSFFDAAHEKGNYVPLDFRKLSLGEGSVTLNRGLKY